MSKLRVEGGPPEESVEQAVVSPDNLRRVVGDMGAKGATDKIEALAHMDLISVRFLLGGLTKKAGSPNLSTLGRSPRGRRRLQHSPI